jgi:deazaflavin-dependent oxidoreductase (nitroreductase family)
VTPRSPSPEPPQERSRAPDSGRLVPGQDDSWLIVASAAGAARNPAWYYNLAAHPDQVWIETAGRKAAVTAEQLHGAERDEA